MGRRSIHALLAAGALLLFALPARTAGTDVAAQEKILKSADDFRFRVDACLKLGASGDFKARKPLEYALEDPHPTVRQAAASGLSKLGDALAIAALEVRLGKEKNAPTKSAIENSIASLKSATPVSTGMTSSIAPDWAKTKMVVKLQRVANDSGVRGDKLAAVLEGSTRAKLAAIPGVFVLPNDSAATPIMAQALSKGVPVLGVDAKVVMLDQATFAGDLKIQAKVSYAISKTQVIKSAIEGNASSIGSLSSAKNPQSLIKLQDMAVDGAVASAMGKAPSALAAAVK
jgi:HEAT repeat protein